MTLRMVRLDFVKVASSTAWLTTPAAYCDRSIAARILFMAGQHDLAARESPYSLHNLPRHMPVTGSCTRIGFHNRLAEDYHGYP